MPIHGRIAGIAGPFIRRQFRGAARYTYNTLRMQDRIIDKTYRKAGLYNRGVVRGIQHGLAGGQIIGGTLSLGLNAEDSPGNSGQIFKKDKPQTRKPYKTRYRQSGRYSRRCPSPSNTYSRKRYS